ncbi:hypothetical protein AAHC03_016392 [Spirometra sp. Aus1]
MTTIPGPRWIPCWRQHRGQPMACVRRHCRTVPALASPRLLRRRWAMWQPQRPTASDCCTSRKRDPADFLGEHKDLVDLENWLIAPHPRRIPSLWPADLRH